MLTNEIFLLATVAFIICLFFGSVRWFYRDPERHPPEGKNVVVSPADGRIAKIKRYPKDSVPSAIKDGKLISIEEIKTAGFTDDDYYLVAIVMSPLDVHINRTPISGQVVFQKRTLGKLVTMRQPIFEFVNERVTTIIENETLRIGVVQIAAPIASSIRCFVNIGDTIQIGQRYGAISLGSQVDVMIPARNKIRISTLLGSKVRAGETILAEVSDRHDEFEKEESEGPTVDEGVFDVQPQGLSRFLQLFYLASLLLASLWLKHAQIRSDHIRCCKSD
jgi:phosphatidylserine decarboxylase